MRVPAGVPRPSFAWAGFFLSVKQDGLRPLLGPLQAAQMPPLLLQLHQDQIHSFVTCIFGQMDLGRSILRVSCLCSHVLFFAIRQSELCLHVCRSEEHTSEL